MKIIKIEEIADRFGGRIFYAENCVEIREIGRTGNGFIISAKIVQDKNNPFEYEVLPTVNILVERQTPPNEEEFRRLH